MNNVTATIDRFTATLHGDPSQESRLAALLRVVADRRLAPDLAAAGLPDGHWCLQRLDLRLELDLDTADADLAAVWSAAVVALVREATRVGRAVHYASDLDALVDLVVSVARHDRRRSWAWRQLGLTASRRPHVRAGTRGVEPEPSPIEAVLTAMHRRPALVVSALRAATLEVGVPALHRILGTRGWRDLADLVTSASASVRSGHPVPSATPVESVAARVHASSVLADLYAESGLRPDEETLNAWTVLVLADTGVPAPDAAALVAVRTHLATRLDTSPAPASQRAPERRADEDPSAPIDPGDPTGGDSAAMPPHAAEPATAAEPAIHRAPDAGPAATHEERRLDAAPDDAGLVTSWAGLLFLLACADEGGVPGRLADDPVLAPRGAAWVLQRVGRRVVAIRPDDPALLAFAGLPADRPIDGDEVPPRPEENAALADLTHGWVTATAERLGSDVHPVFAVASMARRPGLVRSGPGWCQVTMPLDQVDLTVRRAGLDLDPGWVPWLGTTVRYHYE